MKKFAIAGLAAGMLSLGIGIGCYAQANIETIQAFINHGIKFTFNGAAWMPKDSDGKELNPIIYEGSTYVPLRAIGELSGMYVDWDSATSTVILKNASPSKEEAVPYKDAKDYGSTESDMQPPSAENDSDSTYSTFNVHTDRSTEAYKEAAAEAEKQGAIYLTDLKYERIQGTNVLKRVQIDSSFTDEKINPLKYYGKVYARGISAMLDSNATSQKITFNLDGNYTFFNTYYGVDDYARNLDEQFSIKIYADGQLLANKSKSNPNIDGNFVFFDVTGVKKLEIVFEAQTTNYASALALYSPKLFK